MNEINFEKMFVFSVILCIKGGLISGHLSEYAEYMLALM